MKYWEAVLNEVLNKDKKSTRFVFTNLGEMARLRNEKRIQLEKPKIKKEHKMYYLGHDYEGIYFTKREAECMLLLLKGHTIVSAAEVLRLSPRTVEFYVKNMKMKLCCCTKFELVEKVAQSEFIKSLDFDIN